MAAIKRPYEEDSRRTEARRSSIIKPRRSRSRCLESGCQCCKKARNLKKESEAFFGKTFSITILFLVVQRVHDIAAKISQNRRRCRAGCIARSCRNSARFRASQSGPNASRTKVHNTLAAVQEKRICVPVSGTAQRGQIPSPGPCRLSLSVPEGRRSRRSCQTKILIFNGTGAFHRGTSQG